MYIVIECSDFRVLFREEIVIEMDNLLEELFLFGIVL